MMKKYSILTLSFFISQAMAKCPDGKTYPVTLTFDDGPHGTLTPKVLDTLKEEKVPGTFFVLGEHFEGGKSNPSNKKKYEILDRMKKEGHTIGSHTYKHLSHPTLSYEAMKENLNKSNALLKDYLSPVLRLPYGAGAFRAKNPDVQKKNDLVMKTVKESGFEHVLWDIDTNDWDVKKRATLERDMLNQICEQKGGVVLFHDVQSNTAANLKKWIQAIKNEGHSFVKLEHFVPEAGEKVTPDMCDDKYGKLNELNETIDKVIKKLK